MKIRKSAKKVGAFWLITFWACGPRQTCPRDVPQGRNKNLNTHFWGDGTPKNVGGQKNVQNLARYRTTLVFDGKYLWNG